MAGYPTGKLGDASWDPLVGILGSGSILQCMSAAPYSVYVWNAAFNHGMTLPVNDGREVPKAGMTWAMTGGRCLKLSYTLRVLCSGGPVRVQLWNLGNYRMIQLHSGTLTGPSGYAFQQNQVRIHYMSVPTLRALPPTMVGALPGAAAARSRTQADTYKSPNPRTP